ncbi:MAG: CheR family methyltransferase [Pseudomonadota bacterium]
MPDFKTYCAFATGPKAEEEAEELLSALTTNVSSFYRERHHFEALSKTILPGLREKAERSGLRIWSAGCSSGQEPYTIAATVRAAYADLHQPNVTILATDVDPRILQKARAATYRATEVASLSSEQKDLLFAPRNRNAESVTVRDELRRMVSFDRINLVGDWRQAPLFDIIFCRNVVIYFERSTQHRLWQRFRDSLAPRGNLFIGHSERLTGPAEESFRNIGITAFEKTAP